MTREEQMLNGFTEMMRGFWGNQDLKVLGIETPCKQESCDDCISRQAAIDAADKIIERDTSGNNAVVNAMIAWSEYIKTLPSVTPQPKMGKWIPRKGGGFYCSNCKSDSLDEVDGNYIHFPARTKYCHNCGLKMETEE